MVELTAPRRWPQAGREGPEGPGRPHLHRLPAVYCCCCLANVSLPGIGGTVPESKPFFYVNVADIESLEVEVSYVACEYGARPILPAHPWRGRPGPSFSRQRRAGSL